MKEMQFLEEENHSMKILQKKGYIILNKSNQKNNKLFKKEENLPPPIIYNSLNEYDNDIYNLKINVLKYLCIMIFLVILFLFSIVDIP